MSKNILQDVVSNRKRSIRDIPILNKKKKDRNVSEISNIKTMKNKKNNLKVKRGLGAIIFVVIVFLIFSTFFCGTKIILVPKQEKVDFSARLNATKDSVDVAKKGISFNILTISTEGSRTTTNFEEKDVDKKAFGQIIVFNDYDSASQRLIINTRFETSEGLIYRTPKSIIVPGRTTENGKTIPGSIMVTVYADLPGESHNIGLVDFTIPGLEGTDRFSKFYARSKTPMTGGFSGVMKMVSESNLEEMKKDIHTDLETELKNRVYLQIPEGSILYSDGVYVGFESQSDIDLGDSVQIVEKGILNAVFFEKKELSQYVADNTLSDLGETMVEILNLEDLDFNIISKENIKPWEDGNLEFDLNGLANFAWVFDDEKIKRDFAGQLKNDTNFILANYIGIKEAEVVISPFWKRSFPKDVNKIEIVRKLNIE